MTLLEQMRAAREQGRRMTWDELVDALEEAHEARMLAALAARTKGAKVKEAGDE